MEKGVMSTRASKNKTTTPSGTTLATKVYVPSLGLIEDNLPVRPFVFKHWLRRWMGATNEERLGMIRSIPELQLTPVNVVVILRQILFPLTHMINRDFSIDPNKASNLHHKKEGVTIEMLRYEAWFVLCDWFFGSLSDQTNTFNEIAEYLRVKGFAEDIINYFNKKEGWSNISQPNFVVSTMRSDRIRERNQLIEKKTKKAHASIEHFLKHFFKLAWNYKQEADFKEGISEEERLSIHSHVSVALRQKLFTLLVGIKPSWLKDLDWDQEVFRSVVREVTARGESLFTLASNSDDHVAQVAINLSVVAIKEKWVDFPGVQKMPEEHLE